MDAGGSSPGASATARASTNVMRAPFEDNFERAARRPALTPAASGMAATSATDASTDASRGDGQAAALPAEGGVGHGREGGAEAGGEVADLGPDWVSLSPSGWTLEGGRLCGENARNRGVWLQRTLPVNARIEFDAISTSPDGDIKAELWGDGRSGATAVSYTNATSYLTIFGGWKNTAHVLARLDEHGQDRKEVRVDPASDDPRQRAVVPGQTYHFKVERTDGKTVRWQVDGLDMLTFDDGQPLVGAGHDHFGFNNWQVKVCYDNVKITPLP